MKSARSGHFLNIRGVCSCIALLEISTVYSPFNCSVSNLDYTTLRMYTTPIIKTQGCDTLCSQCTIIKFLLVLTMLVILCVNNTPHSKCLLVLTALVSYNHVCRYTHARLNNEVESTICQYTCYFVKFAGSHQLFAYRHVPAEEKHCC